MAVLPILSGRNIVRAFEKDGWKIARQRGSHMILVKEGYMATLSVPDHREVARGTLRSLIRASGIRVELTATTRASLQRHTFPVSDQARLVFDFLIPSEYQMHVLGAEARRTESGG